MNDGAMVTGGGKDGRREIEVAAAAAGRRVGLNWNTALADVDATWR